MAGEGAALRADAPAVEIVHVVDAFDGTDGVRDQLELNAPGGAFEQNIKALAHDAEARPENERADPERERGIDPVIACSENCPASGDHGGSGERVAHFMQESAANVD